MLLYEKKGAVGILTVNRPEALNAINSALLDELYDKVSEIAADESVRCLILTGSGKAFVAGADIGEMKDLSKQEGYEFGMRGHRSFTAVENLEIPVIAAVNGYALGGTQRLIRTVNRAKAMEMILTARTVSAQEALEMGLVSRVVPGEELMNTALALAESIAANAPVAVRNAKAAVRRSYARELNEDLEAEAKLFADCFETEDQRMAMTAFVNKTPKTEFKGK